jgi:hypothetical protein
MGLFLIPLIPLGVRALIAGAAAVAAATAVVIHDHMQPDPGPPRPAQPPRLIVQSQHDAAQAAHLRITAAIPALHAMGADQQTVQLLMNFFQEAQHAIDATIVGNLWQPVLALATTANDHLHTFIEHITSEIFVSTRHLNVPQVNTDALKAALEAWRDYVVAMH